MPAHTHSHTHVVRACDSLGGTGASLTTKPTGSLLHGALPASRSDSQHVYQQLKATRPWCDSLAWISSRWKKGGSAGVREGGRGGATTTDCGAVKQHGVDGSASIVCRPRSAAAGGVGSWTDRTDACAWETLGGDRRAEPLSSRGGSRSTSSCACCPLLGA